jgi:hypothetical protein
VPRRGSTPISALWTVQEDGRSFQKEVLDMKNLTLRASWFASISFACALILVVGSTYALGQGDEELKRRFVQEAPSRWEEYVRLSGEVQGILTISHTASLNAFEEQSRLEYKTNGRGKLLKVFGRQMINGKVEPEDEEIFGINSDYAFALRRKSPSSFWLLTDLIKVNNGSDLSKVASRFIHYLRGVTYAVYFDGEPLTEVVHKPDFRLGHCRKIKCEGEDLVEVSFTYTKMDDKWNRSLQGKLVFDPNRYWCLRSGESQVTGNFATGTDIFHVTQSDNAGRLPPLSRVYLTDGD